MKNSNHNGIPPFATLPLRHYFMFGQVMQNPRICKLFLEALFEWEIEDIKYVHREKDLDDSFLSRGVRLDIYLRDSDTVYNVEMQSDREPSLERRIRYYQSGIDREELRKGCLFEELPDSYIIFICDYDPLGQGFAKYERQSHWCGSYSESDDADNVSNDTGDTIHGADRTDQTDDKLITCNDGAHAILLNSRYTQRNASPAILEFLDYIRTNDDAADYSSILTQEAKAEVCGVRQDEKIGRQYMRIELELQKQHRLGLAEGLVEGESHGKTKKLIEQVCKKLSKGKSPKTIAEELEEDLSVIEAICRAAEPFAPDCDVEAIYEAIQRPSSDETHPCD